MRVELDHPGGDVLEKIPIVACNDESEGVFFAQEGLQPQDSLEVEVVCGFIEQEQLGRIDERFGEI